MFRGGFKVMSKTPKKSQINRCILLCSAKREILHQNAIECELFNRKQWI